MHSFERSKRLDPLERVLRSCADAHVVVLAERLLRFCRAHLGFLETAGEEMTKAPYLELRRTAAEIFAEQVSGGDIEQEDISALIRLLRGSALPPPLAARAIAVALDEELGTVIALSFRGKSFSVRPNRAIPVANPLLSEEVLRGRTPNPDKYEAPLDGIRNLRLAPAHLPFEVSICCNDDPILGLNADARIAIGLPVSHLDQDHSTSELVWDRYDRDGKPVFFNVRPKDPEALLGRTLDMLNAAEAQGAHLLVLPELCTDDRIVDELRRVLRERAGEATTPIVVAGSRHTVAELRRNRATVFLPDGTEFFHDKFEPFAFEDRASDSDSNQVERHEDFQPDGRRLHLLVGPRASLAVLICKDAMPKRAADVLVAFGIRTVIVPAMSPKTSPFDRLGYDLAEHVQGTVVVANCTGASNGQAAAALVARPLERQVILKARRRDVAPPCILVANLLSDDQLTVEPMEQKLSSGV